MKEIYKLTLENGVCTNIHVTTYSQRRKTVDGSSEKVDYEPRIAYLQRSVEECMRRLTEAEEKCPVTDRLFDFICSKQHVSYKEAERFIRFTFAECRDFYHYLEKLSDAKKIFVTSEADGVWLHSVKPEKEPT